MYPWLLDSLHTVPARLIWQLISILIKRNLHDCMFKRIWKITTYLRGLPKRRGPRDQLSVEFTEQGSEHTSKCPLPEGYLFAWIICLNTTGNIPVLMTNQYHKKTCEWRVGSGIKSCIGSDFGLRNEPIKECHLKKFEFACSLNRCVNESSHQTGQ